MTESLVHLHRFFQLDLIYEKLKHLCFYSDYYTHERALEISYRI